MLEDDYEYSELTRQIFKVTEIFKSLQSSGVQTPPTETTEQHQEILSAYQPVSEDELSSFEQKYGIALPEDYRLFLKLIGCGGPLQLIPLSQALHDDDGWGDKRVSLPFPLTRKTHIDEIIDGSVEDRYHCCGVLRLQDYGCGSFVLLVVSGPSYGQVWSVENSPEIYWEPHHPSFLHWLRGPE